MKKLELEPVKDERAVGYYKMFTSVSMDDYFKVERMAHERARERVAYVDGKRVPYVVKMSMYAADVDREKELLEDNFKRGMVQADIIVFESVEQKKRFREDKVLVYKQNAR